MRKDHDGLGSEALVLFAYFTQQTLKVVEAMGEVLRGRGYDVELAAIEFTDPRYEKRFSQFPMPRPFLEVVATIPAELRRRPAKIRSEHERSQQAIPSGGA